MRGKIASPIPGQRIELARCVASAIVKIMREKRSRREADVYKAKIGRDAIIDIHVRRYSSKPYYFHPKSTGALVARGCKTGLIYLQEAHRRFAGDRQTDRKTERQTSAGRSQHSNAAPSQGKTPTPSAAFQVPHRNTAPYESHQPLPTLHLCTSSLSHTREESSTFSKRKSRLETRDELGVKHPILRPGSSIRQQAPASWKAGTGSLAVSRQDSPSPTREVGSPALRPQPQSLFFAGLI